MGLWFAHRIRARHGLELVMRNEDGDNNRAGIGMLGIWHGFGYCLVMGISLASVRRAQS